VDGENNVRREAWTFRPRVVANPFVALPSLPEEVVRPRALSVADALYVLDAAGMWRLSTEGEMAWQAVNTAPVPPVAPDSAAVVVMSPYVYVLGGTGEEAPQAAAWRYQVIFTTFVPFVSGNEQDATPTSEPNK